MKFKTYFKDLIDPSLIVGVLVIIAVSILLTLFFASKVSSFKEKYKGKFYTYLIGIILVFLLITFIGSSEVFNSQVFNIFIFYQSVFFLLGILHCYFYKNYFESFDAKPFWVEFLFILLITIYSTIPVIFMYTIVKGNQYAYYMSLSTLVFIIPTCIYSTFEAAISIAPKIYKTWLFPEEHAYKDPDDNEFRDVLMVTFVFHKDPNSEERTFFSAKAPIRMDFGRLFFHFVNDYNLRNPDGPISLKDKDGERQHWVFYVKSKNLGLPQYIRPKYPLYMNKIEENSVIICLRTSAYLESEEMPDPDMAKPLNKEKDIEQSEKGAEKKIEEQKLL